MPYLDSDMAVSTSTMTMESEMTDDLAELTASALGKPYDRDHQQMKKLEPAAKIDENGVEYCSSRPPTPPSTGANTPTLRIAACPLRLWPFVPPPQYGVVEDYTIFRSSYPQDRNMDFIKTLEIKSILTLVETDPTPGYVQWLEEREIKRRKVTIAPNKEAKEGKSASATSMDSLCEALLFVMDGSHHPLWIHCNQGRHRTGCVVACLRKIQGMPVEKVIQEYIAYASPKERPGDIELIQSFDPNVVFAYAQQTGFIGGPDPKFKHTGPTPITNVYELARELAQAGCEDSVTANETMQALEELSATLSEASLSEQSDSRSETSVVAMPSHAPPPVPGANSLDSEQSANGRRPHRHTDMSMEVVDGHDQIDDVGQTEPGSTLKDGDNSSSLSEETFY